MSDEHKTHPTQFKEGNQIGKATQFSSTNQPKNRRKGKTISSFLKQIGEGTAIEFDIKLTDAQGREVHKKGKISAGTSGPAEGEPQEPVTINEVFAQLMYVDALKGDKKTRREILDRTEGRPASFLDITSQGNVITLGKDERRSMIEKLSAKLLSRGKPSNQ